MEKEFNKVFDRGTIGGLVVAAVDGTQTFNSDKKHCENCLKASKKGQKEQRNLIDVVVYDAIACNSEWLNACVDSDIDAVIRVKGNNVKSNKEIKRQVNKLDPVAVWTGFKDYESTTI